MKGLINVLMLVGIILMMLIIAWAAYYFNQPGALIGLILPAILGIFYGVYIMIHTKN